MSCVFLIQRFHFCCILPKNTPSNKRKDWIFIIIISWSLYIQIWKHARRKKYYGNWYSSMSNKKRAIKPFRFSDRAQTATATYRFSYGKWLFLKALKHILGDEKCWQSVQGWWPGLYIYRNGTTCIQIQLMLFAHIYPLCCVCQMILCCFALILFFPYKTHTFISYRSYQPC